MARDGPRCSRPTHTRPVQAPEVPALGFWLSRKVCEALAWFNSTQTSQKNKGYGRIGTFADFFFFSCSVDCFLNQPIVLRPRQQNLEAHSL